MLVQNILKFLSRKRYQYEVTFSLYMLTPMEKLVFNTGALIALTLLLLAISLYLPHHITTIASRAWFYYAGEGTECGALGCYNGGHAERSGVHAEL